MKRASISRCFAPRTKPATVCRILATDKGLSRKSHGIMDGHKNKKHAKGYRDPVRFRIPTKDEKRMAYSFANSRRLDRFL